MTVPDLGIRPDKIVRPRQPVGPKVFRWVVFTVILIPAIWSATGLNIDVASLNPFHANSSFPFEFSPEWRFWSGSALGVWDLLFTALLVAAAYWGTRRPTPMAIVAAASLLALAVLRPTGWHFEFVFEWWYLILIAIPVGIALWFSRKPATIAVTAVAALIVLEIWRPVDWKLDFSWSWPYLIVVAAIGLIVYWLSKRLYWSLAATAVILVLPWFNIWNPDWFWFDIWKITQNLFPPDLSPDAIQRAMPKVMESIFIAWIGTMIGAFFSFPLAFLAAKNMTPAWVNTGIRQVLNGIRAVPELLVAMLLIPITGLGPWTGTMALGIHSIGTLGKLSSEVVEGIDPGPVEAVAAVGGGRVSRIRFAVIPQVMPTIVAYWLYRFEINIRASAVLGVVGAGGVGAELVSQLRFRDFARAGTVLFLTIGAVLAVDTISARVRRRIISGEPEPSPLTNFLGRNRWQRALALLMIGILAFVVVFLLRQLQVDLNPLL